MAEKASEIEENMIDSLFKEGLNREGKKIWDVIISNPSVQIERDFMTVVMLIETYQEFIYYKKQLKNTKNPDHSDPRVKENTNDTQQVGWAVKGMQDSAALVMKLVKELGLTPMSAKELNQIDVNNTEKIRSLLKSDRR